MADSGVAVIVPGQDGGLTQFASHHSLIDAPTGFSFAKEGRFAPCHLPPPLGVPLASDDASVCSGGFARLAGHALHAFAVANY